MAELLSFRSLCAEDERHTILAGLSLHVDAGAVIRHKAFRHMHLRQCTALLQYAINRIMKVRPLVAAVSLAITAFYLNPFLCHIIFSFLYTLQFTKIAIII